MAKISHSPLVDFLISYVLPNTFTFMLYLLQEFYSRLDAKQCEFVPKPGSLPTICTNSGRAHFIRQDRLCRHAEFAQKREIALRLMARRV
jgi:hypothetical protein